MPIIAGVTVNWQLSPRVITIPSAEVEVSIRDLQDTLKDLEDNEEGILWPDLRATSGGEDLGGGVSVGWTMELQDAVIAPAPRLTSISAGSATTVDPNGLVLIDSAATFISDGVEPGATIFNITDDSVTSIISVDSETQVTHYALEDGTDNDWDSADSYKIWNEVQFNISGGNLVAIDDLGASVSAIRSTFGNEILKTSASSATSTEQDAIQYSSYGGGISVDIINGITGVAYPSGNQEFPVDNLVEAVAIANSKGFKTIFIRESMTLNSGTLLNNFTFIGRSHVLTEVTIAASALTSGVTIENCNVSGVLDGGSDIRGCMVGNITYVNGHFHDSGLYGNIVLDGSDDAVLVNCHQVGTQAPTIDMGGSGQNLSLTEFSGNIEIYNTTNAFIRADIGMATGSVTLASNITAGIFTISGIGALIDQSTSTTLLDVDGLMSKATVSSAVWDEPLSVHNTVGSASVASQYDSYGGGVTISTGGVSGTGYPIGTLASPVDNIADAHTIMATLGVTKMFFASDWTFTTVMATGHRLHGEGLQTVFTFQSGSSNIGSDVHDATVTGAPFGIIEYRDCHIVDITDSGLSPISTDLDIRNTFIQGTITTATDFTGNLNIINCWGLPDAVGNPPTIDMNAAAAELQMRNYSGIVNIANYTQSNDVRIFLTSGGAVLNSTVTAGDFLISGVGELTDNSTSVDSLNTDGLINKKEITEISWDRVHVDSILGVAGTAFPLGTASNPVSNMEDAKTIAIANNVWNLHIEGSVTLVSSFSKYSFHGRSPNATTINLGGQDITFTDFNDCLVTGTQASSSIFKDCEIDNLQGLQGNYVGCALATTTPLQIAINANVYMNNCRSQVAGSDSPILDYSNGGIGLNMRAYSGGIRVINSTDATNVTTVEFIAGKLNFPVSNTAGYFAVRGVVDLTNVDTNATATVVETGGINTANITDAVWNNPVESGVTTNDAIKALLATMAGEASGGGTSSIVFKNPAGDETRVTMTVDTNGNRSAVTLNT